MSYLMKVFNISAFQPENRKSFQIRKLTRGSLSLLQVAKLSTLISSQSNNDVARCYADGLLINLFRLKIPQQQW